MMESNDGLDDSYELYEKEQMAITADETRLDELSRNNGIGDVSENPVMDEFYGRLKIWLNQRKTWIA